MCLEKGIFVQLPIETPPKKGSFGQYTQQNGRNSQNSPVLLCLGSNWEVIFARFQPKTGVFVHYLQFIVYFVNFLQDILL